MERPQPLAGAHVVGADIALGVVALGWREALPERRAHDDRIAHDRRRRMEARFAGRQVDLLVPVGLQVHLAGGPETRNARAALGVQRQQTVAGGDVVDSLVLPIGPIAHAPPGKLSRRGRGAGALPLRMHPHQLAGGRVESHHAPPRAPRGVDHPAHHQRRALQLELRPVAEGVGLEPPSHLQLGEIGRVDLVQRAVAAAGQVGGVGGPLHILGGLGQGRPGHQQSGGQGAGGERLHVRVPLRPCAQAMSFSLSRASLIAAFWSPLTSTNGARG